MKFRHLFTLIIVIVCISACATPQSRKAYLDKQHPEWSDQQRAMVSRQSVWVGMSKEQAIASWGRPSSVNSTVTGHANWEQWVYRTYMGRTLGSVYRYLYFDGDKLVAVQQ